MTEQAIETLKLVTPGPTHAKRCFEYVAAALYARLPYAEIEHVGSTAVPGCLTKGDVDVLVRVSSADFVRARTTLDEFLVRSSRNEPTESYTEYEHPSSETCVSVQLVAAGGFHDRSFHGLKAVLRSNPDALRLYNDLKVRCDGREMEEYRRAKGHLIESLLVSYRSDDEPVLRPGIQD